MTRYRDSQPIRPSAEARLLAGIYRLAQGLVLSLLGAGIFAIIALRTTTGPGVLIFGALSLIPLVVFLVRASIVAGPILTGYGVNEDGPTRGRDQDGTWMPVNEPELSPDAVPWDAYLASQSGDQPEAEVERASSEQPRRRNRGRK